ncbi:MAG: NADH-ubiquinone oxidoreductase-F iron-sulfur binding region domain-containing protein [Limnochordia bacterium]|jgi:NADH-quinone oxidoreductase subunit F/NADP-reducing hydrogenase subunit HndC
MIRTRDDLLAFQRQQAELMQKEAAEKKAKVLVGMGTCGIAAGAQEVYDAICDELRKRNIDDVAVAQTGCIGFCAQEPLAEVILPGSKKVLYGQIDAEKAREIVAQHIAGGKPVTEWAVNGRDRLPEDVQTDDEIVDYEQVPFFKTQLRIALRNCGVINPESLGEYVVRDGYQSLAKVLTEMTPADVIEEIKKAGLRGRGGGGFPTGVKWEFAYNQPKGQKYIVCNADEGDPGAFMDRSILEGDPHSVVEGMAIGAYAIGADKGYIYCRAEYPIAVKRLNLAIAQAKEMGLLGENILGTGFNFDLEVRLGAGAFVCGEETALLASIEGERGEPRLRPPYPAVSGLWGKPTIINNVETFANVAPIIHRGADWFSGIGSDNSKGTKVFALAGEINNIGLAEIPMGTTLREVIFEIGGGIPEGKQFKGAQTGGPSGGCIPAEYLDTPIDYDNLAKLGTIMGSGGLIIMAEDTCMVDLARFFLDFTQEESCGKCPPCRVGTTVMLDMLNRIVEGKGEEGDLEKLEELGQNIKAASLCGLGQTAPNPVLSTMRYFREEYEEHVYGKKCRSGVCAALFQYYIIPDKCKRCGICAKKCPVQCISGDRNTPYVIDQDPCIKCGVCMESCPFDAIIKH